MTPARIAAKITTPAQLALVQATIAALQFDEEVALAAGLGAKAASIASVRSAVGLASANLDAQLDAIPTAIDNADALLNRDMSAVSDTTARSPLNALRFIRNRWVDSGGTLTVYKENDSTTAWTAASTGTPGADPITGIDPA